MPAFDRIASFRFRRGMSRTRFLKAAIDIASKYGVTSVRHKTLCKRLLSKKAVADAVREIFRAEDREALRTRHVVPLPPEKLKILTRKVHFDEYHLRRRDGSLTLRVEMSDGNNFPALGASIWLSKSLKLPAGFVRVRGEDAVAARKLFWDLRVLSQN